MKRRIVTGRGTSFKDIEVGNSEWSGKSFAKYQKERMTKLPEKLLLSAGKGTGKKIAAEYSKLEPKIPVPKVVTSSKGTSRFHLH